MTTELKQTAKWYTELCTKHNELMNRLGLPEEFSVEIKSLLVEIAKSQYKTGNRCGIRYAHEQMAKKSAA
jgi:hypothetical protein